MRLLPNETKRRYHDRRLQNLKEIRQPWEAHWRDLADFNAPARLRLLIKQKEGDKLRSSIIDSTSTFALRTLASGMHSGITSPARPWFKLGPLDDDMKEYKPVRDWLSKVESEMRKVFAQSNIYNAFHTGYGDLGLFGQSCGLLVEDERRVVRMVPMIHGAFWIARDENGMANTLYRQFYWSCERIVARFGYKNCSRLVQECYDKGDYDERFIVNHAVEPRHDREPGKIDRKNKPYLSNYWEDGSDRNSRPEGLLEESGFDSNPIIAPPWLLTADDHYAVSPGMDALPDVKVLQKLQLWSGEAVEKGVRPPMKGPTSLRNNPSSLLPNSITYVDDPNGRGFSPVMEVQLRISEVEAKIQQTQQRIDRAYYADLFLMLANMEGIQPRNAFEIAERKEEKLLALGPVLENIFGNQLSPTIDRTFEAMVKRDMIPPPPPELEGQDLKVEYISMLAQAQKAVATGSIERLVAFAGNLAGANPTVLDKVNLDQAIDEYADLIGSPPSIVVSDDEVKSVRDQRAQQQQQAAQMEQMAQMAPAIKQGADAARLLSETDQGGQNILQRLGLA